jgi:arylformamidase
MNEKEYIDLSHTIEQGMVTYRGIPAPIIRDFLTREDSKKNYEAGTEFHIGIIEIASNTGTYLDTPFHRYADGADLSEITLETLAGINGILINARTDGVMAIDETCFKGMELKGKAVIIYTGWDKYWQTDRYYHDHPFVTENAAKLLAAGEVKLVGVDTYNIDDTRTRIRPAHSTLLLAGIPIIEHLCNLHQLSSKEFRFFCIPPKIKGLGSFPVRAFAEIIK